MRRDDVILELGSLAKVNGSGDLMMDRSLGKHIGNTGKINRLTKGGLVELLIDGETIYLPPRNVDVVES